MWRCLGQFDRLALPAAAIVDTALVDYALELVAVCLRHDDELVGHKGYPLSSAALTIAL